MASKTADPDTEALLAELSRHVEGEVRFDKMSRMLYSTDASIYQIEPVGVVIPRHADDVVATVETAVRFGVPVLPRGGGTSLAGQTVGRAIVIDFSKYMRRVVEVNPEEHWVRTQPGIILDELNQQMRPHGLMFAPDPSTSNRGNVGGAIGNNSCGSHSVMWGKTIDHVHELNVVLSNGETARFGPLSGDQLESKLRGDGLESSLFAELISIGEAHRDEVRARYPRIQRRVSGYNLDELTGEGPLDMARFVVGSEGTLLSVTEAKLRLVPRLKHTALAILHFSELIESMEATVVALESEPSAVELIGSMILRQAKGNLEYARMMDWVQGDPEAVIAVEVAGDSEAELADRLDALEERIRRAGLGYAVTRLSAPADQARVWAVRKAGLGLMMNVQGDAKPLPFVEDTAVAPEKLPEFVRRFDRIVRGHGTTAGYYGHASVGCLHIRPLVDLKVQVGVDRMVAIAEEVSDLVLEYGGAMSGEHGDGLVRSVWIKKMFGPRIYDAFREVKKAFDPQGIMNPGKIVDSPPMTENLRISPAYRTLELGTGHAFAQESGFAGAIEMCNGQGACRKVTGGTMCPSYMVTRDEEHSTRGRANALRSAISGALPLEELDGRRLYEVLELCVECKACKAECPSNVDMTRIKYEFLDRFHKANGLPLRNRFFADIARLSRLACFFAPLSNWAVSTGLVGEVLESFVQIDRRRSLPRFASQTFPQWWRARGGSPPSAARVGQVVLFADTFTSYNHPNLGRAATLLLESLGYQVIVPDWSCCGRPMLSSGMLDRAKLHARRNVELAYPYVERGARVVGIEPSCVLALGDDYVDLLGGDPRAKAVAESTMLVEEFVIYARSNGGLPLEFKDQPQKLLFHGHCHQKALVRTAPALEVLGSIPGCEVEEIDAGCCGMAGSFGYHKEHYDTSMQMGEERLFPAIRSRGGDFEVVSEGVSCRQQILDGTGRKARHLVEVLADALQPPA